MLIIADSGSTKTSWSIVDGQRVVQKETVGLNPLLTEESVISQSFLDVMREAGNEKVKSVYFYGAGCASEILCSKVRKAISSVAKNDEIIVQSDIYAAAHGLLIEKSGWIAILGTGANLAHYDGQELKRHNPSLGYIVGDEGSGAYLGKELLKMIYYRQCPDELIRAFEEYTKVTLSDILENIYRKPFANRYLASFTYFIKQNDNFDCIKYLLINSFDNFIKLHILPYKNLYSPEIAFTGSVAYVFQKELKEVCNKFGLSIIALEKSPMKGLIQYHSR